MPRSHPVMQITYGRREVWLMSDDTLAVKVPGYRWYRRPATEDEIHVFQPWRSKRELKNPETCVNLIARLAEEVAQHPLSHHYTIRKRKCFTPCHPTTAANTERSPHSDKAPTESPSSKT